MGELALARRMEDGDLDLAQGAHRSGRVVGDADGLLDGRVEQLHVADHQPLAIVIGAFERGQPVGLGPGQGQGLLAQDRQAVLERGGGDVAMRPGGQHDQPIELDGVEHRRDVAESVLGRYPVALADGRQERRRRGRRSPPAGRCRGGRRGAGRWTAWATAPRPATPTRRGRRGARREGEWAIVAEYTGEPDAVGRRPVTVTLTVACALPQTRRHVRSDPPGVLARPPWHGVVARGDRLPDLPAQLRRHRRQRGRGPARHHRPPRPPRPRRPRRRRHLAVADLPEPRVRRRLRRQRPRRGRPAAGDRGRTSIGSFARRTPAACA